MRARVFVCYTHWDYRPVADDLIQKHLASIPQNPSIPGNPIGFDPKSVRTHVASLSFFLCRLTRIHSFYY